MPNIWSAIVSRAAGLLSPSVARDLQSARYAADWVLPPESSHADRYVPSHYLGHGGFELDVDGQLARLKNWQADSYQECFRQLRADKEINVGFAGGDWLNSDRLHNGYYPTPDAEIYAAMILDFQPERIVEVGSGFSTRIARAAIRYADLPTQLTVIDPQPRTDVADVADEVIRRPVEQSGLIDMPFTGKSLLFIDSSHVCRARGDIPYLFCQLLPQLPEGTCVQIHDIFTPWDYPTNYDPLCYTEQYVLQAILTAAPRFRTLFSTHYMSREHGAAMRDVFGSAVGNDNLFFGASWWLEVVAKQ